MYYIKPSEIKFLKQYHVLFSSYIFGPENFLTFSKGVESPEGSLQGLAKSYNYIIWTSYKVNQPLGVVEALHLHW